MKLIVVDKNSINNKGITFVLPTILIKSKVFWKFVYKEKEYYVSVNIFKKMYKQINRDFSQASYKSSEYQEVYDSWLRISDAMNELDKEASELSSCVDDLKNQLDSVIGK